MSNKLSLDSKKYILEDVLKYEQPTKYIVKSTNYDDSYNTPVLTAGKSFIIGYTNETEGVCNTLPVIIFDDFTTSSQYVDFPFKVKSSAMKILHATDEANIKYLYYLMQTIQHKADTHKRYWISEYSQREINLPSKYEQNKIVEKIEEEFGKIDEGVEKLKLAQEQIKQYRQSVLKSAFEGKLYKTTNWVEKQLKTISDVLGGYAFKSEYYTNNGFQIIRMGNIKPLKINYGEKPVYINNFDTKIIDKYSLQINDIVITLTGTRKKRDYGYVAIINSNNLLLNQRLARLRFKKDCYPKYFLYALQSEPFQTKFFSYETGNVGQGNVSIKAITEEYIDVPTLNEQKQIVAEIEKRFAIADEAERIINDNLANAEQLKQSILKKAFEGRLVPQDPTDEPASELLAKIHAERGT